MIIYNTLSREKEEFASLEKDKIKMYVCGPTVYDVPHIGHARSSYIFDMIRRYLEYAGNDVCFVRNVTDVDDKIINKALGELEKAQADNGQDVLCGKVKEVATRYLEDYHKEMDNLGLLRPTIEPKATENIGEMIKFIETLIEKGYAYDVDGDVYFSVDKFAEYGKLSNQNKDEIMHAVRIDPDPKKKHPLDFALWKEAKSGEPFWDSPWGAGRPGWHIECSVMSTNIFGPSFDIHGGGLDLIFPHHENEIAQAEAATGSTFARYWIHNGLLTVNGEKMSKSLGNYITIGDFVAKHGDVELLKLAFLNSHYRSPMDYSDAKMEETGKARERIINFIDKTNKLDEESLEAGEVGQKESDGEIVSLKKKFEEAMEDDFNTPQAMSVIFDAVHKGNVYLSDEDMNPEDKEYKTRALKDFILKFCNILGLSMKVEDVSEEEVMRIEELIKERNDARGAKDYARADKVRDELLAMGITIEDTPEGTTWRKK